MAFAHVCGWLAGMCLMAASAWGIGYQQGIELCDEVGRSKATFRTPLGAKLFLAAGAALAALAISTGQ